MLSKDESSTQETLDGVVVQYRTRTKGRLFLSRSAGQANHTPNGDSGKAQDSMHLRLPLQDLRRGAWVSTREGDLQRLWVVESINTGAGDGCIELTLAPKES